MPRTVGVPMIASISPKFSHSEDDLIEDENAPDGDFDGLELPDMIDSDSFWL